MWVFEASCIIQMNIKAKLSQKFMARILEHVDKNIEHVYSGIKKKLFSQIRKKDKVLEIGAGTGVNFKYYHKGLNLMVIEPNVLLHEPLLRNALLNKINIKIIKSSEKLPFDDMSFDFVVSTLVLCSVHDVRKSLIEIKRVLKKRGKFLFIEHILDYGNSFRRGIQHVLAYSPWVFFGDNCHPNRRTSELILKSGFSDVKIKRYYQNGLGFMGWWIKRHVVGKAVK